MKTSTFIRQAALVTATHDEPFDREALARHLVSVRRAVDDVEQLVQCQPSPPTRPARAEAGGCGMDAGGLATPCSVRTARPGAVPKTPDHLA